MAGMMPSELTPSLSCGFLGELCWWGGEGTDGTGRHKAHLWPMYTAQGTQTRESAKEMLGKEAHLVGPVTPGVLGYLTRAAFPLLNRCHSERTHAIPFVSYFMSKEGTQACPLQ